jgi:hypothetical protein
MRGAIDRKVFVEQQFTACEVDGVIAALAIASRKRQFAPGQLAAFVVLLSAAD